MKQTIIILLFLVIFTTEGVKLYPQSFPALQELTKNSDEAFHVACRKSWLVLASISAATGYSFPVDLFALDRNPGYVVNVECSADQEKSILLTFTAPSCEVDFKGSPIVFEIYEREMNSSKIKFRRISTCIKEKPSKKDLMIGTGYIGHVNDMAWYLLHHSYLYPTGRIFYSKRNKVRFGLIIFGRDTEDSDAVVKNALNDVNVTFFNSLLNDDVSDDIHKIDYDSCKPFWCNHKTEVDKKDKVPSKVEIVVKSEGEKLVCIFEVVIVTSLMFIWINF